VKLIEFCNHIMENKRLKVHISVILIIHFLLISGCSFPRIIILDDALTPEEDIALGVAYEKEGNFDDAIKKYRSAAKKNPVAYFYLGNAYFHKNDLDNAEKYYKKTIKEKPGYADAYNNLAWLYYVKRVNLEKAESLAEEALRLNPEKAEVYLDTLEKIRAIK